MNEHDRMMKTFIVGIIMGHKEGLPYTAIDSFLYVLYEKRISKEILSGYLNQLCREGEIELAEDCESWTLSQDMKDVRGNYIGKYYIV